MGKPVTWSYAARLSSRGWILLLWANGQNHNPARLKLTLMRRPIPPTSDSGAARDVLPSVLPMLVPIGALAGTLRIQWAAKRPVMRATAKQLSAFLRDDAPTRKRERPRRERPRVNGPRYPSGEVGGVELVDVGCFLSMTERRRHPSRLCLCLGCSARELKSTYEKHSIRQKPPQTITVRPTQAASNSHQVGLCRALPVGMQKGFQSEDGFCVNLAHTGFRDF